MNDDLRRMAEEAGIGIMAGHMLHGSIEELEAFARKVAESCAVEADRTHAPFTASCIRSKYSLPG
jgi:hypothetical protein